MRARLKPIYASSPGEGDATEPMGFLEKQALGLRFGCVLVTNDSDKAEFRHASEHLGRNIRTAWEVAEVFGELFFAPVRSCEARLDRYLRN
jgi:hypothetical protein